MEEAGVLLGWVSLYCWIGYLFFSRRRMRKENAKMKAELEFLRATVASRKIDIPWHGNANIPPDIQRQIVETIYNAMLARETQIECDTRSGDVGFAWPSELEEK